MLATLIKAIFKCKLALVLLIWYLYYDMYVCYQLKLTTF